MRACDPVDSEVRSRCVECGLDVHDRWQVQVTFELWSAELTIWDVEAIRNERRVVPCAKDGRRTAPS